MTSWETGVSRGCLAEEVKLELDPEAGIGSQRMEKKLRFIKGLCSVQTKCMKSPSVDLLVQFLSLVFKMSELTRSYSKDVTEAGFKVNELESRACF